MLSRKSYLILMFIVLLTTLVACSNGNSENTNEESSGETVTINLYTSESQDQVGAMMNEFKKDHPNINIDIFRTGTEEVIAKLEAERSAGGIEADMIWIADIDYFNSLDEEDMLEEYASPNAENLNEDFIYNGGKYYEVRQIFNVLAYNTTQVTDPLESWHDLYRDDLEGRVAIANPNYSGAASLTLATLVSNEEFGWDFYKSLRDNSLKFEQGNGGLASKVSSGEYHAVSVVDFMARNAQNEGSPVEVVWPEEGAVIIPTPVGILNDSDVTEEAKLVMDFLLSEEAQVMFKDQGYIPVNPDVGVPENAPNVEEIDIMPLDLDFVKENREYLKTEFSNIFGE